MSRVALNIIHVYTTPKYLKNTRTTDYLVWPIPSISTYRVHHIASESFNFPNKKLPAQENFIPNFLLNLHNEPFNFHYFSIKLFRVCNQTILYNLIKSRNAELNLQSFKEKSKNP